MAAYLKPALVERNLRTRAVGRVLVCKRRTTSTMDDARALAEDGAPHGAVVVAEEQTAGRGTRGRGWVSPQGQNLLFTIVVRPSAPQLARLSMITPLALATAVEQVTGLYPRIKWPNDLQVRGRKLAGILIEAAWEPGRPTYALVGVGLNVNFDPGATRAGIDRPATSLAAERGRPLPREPLLAAVLTAFERAYEGWAHPALYAGWRARLNTLGRAVTVTGYDNVPHEGVAEDVTEEGGLVVRLADGRLETYHAGEVTLRTPMQPIVT